MMRELDINKLKDEVQSTLADEGTVRPFWGSSLSEKRIKITPTELNAMEKELAGILSDDATESTTEVAKPTTQEEATQGLGGYKLDTGKPRWDLAPFDAFEAMVKVQTWAVSRDIRGDKAYPERNWERGMAWSRVFGAMIRHSWKWWLGKMTGRSTVDEESGMSHLWHAFTSAGFLVAYELRGMTEFDDRPSITCDKLETK
jgi:hypothetical protein